MKTGKTISRLPAWDSQNPHKVFQIVVIYLLLIKSKTWRERPQYTTDSSFQGKPSCIDPFNYTFVLLITELTKRFKLHLQFRKYASIIRIVLQL